MEPLHHYLLFSYKIAWLSNSTVILFSDFIVLEVPEPSIANCDVPVAIRVGL